MTQLYHVSRRVYASSQVVRIIDGVNDFSIRIAAEGMGWVEDELEALRPAAVAKRTSAQYAFDSLGAALRFAHGEARQRHQGQLVDWHFYRVEMLEPTRHPMHLIERVLRLGPSQGEHVIREYWKPTQPWKRYEYIAAEMRILERVHPPPIEEYQIDLYKATIDVDLANRLWGRLSRT